MPAEPKLEDLSKLSIEELLVKTVSKQSDLAQLAEALANKKLDKDADPRETVKDLNKKDLETLKAYQKEREEAGKKNAEETFRKSLESKYHQFDAALKDNKIIAGQATQLLKASGSNKEVSEAEASAFRELKNIPSDALVALQARGASQMTVLTVYTARKELKKAEYKADDYFKQIHILAEKMTGQSEALRISHGEEKWRPAIEADYTAMRSIKESPEKLRERIDAKKKEFEERDRKNEKEKKPGGAALRAVDIHEELMGGFSPAIQSVSLPPAQKGSGHNTSTLSL